MRRSLRLSTVVIAIGATVLATTTALAGTAAAVPSAASGDAAGPASHVVRLVTGEAINVRTVDGRTVAAPLHSGAERFSTMALGTHRYVVPRAARLYLPSVLDPALFDVTSLGAAKIPLDVTFAGARPTIPGLTVTSSTSTSLRGYLPAAGTAAFGAALRAQFRRDVHAGVTVPSRLFGAARIALATAPVVHPDFPQVTLIIKATGHDGSKLRFGFVGLINTDDGRKYTGLLVTVNGEARASVPVGNYSMIGEEDAFDETPDSFQLHTWIKTVPDFSVTANRQVVDLNLADATVTPSIRTPQPASLNQLGLEWERTVPNGGLGFGYSFFPGDTVKVAPAPAPVHGEVDWVTSWSLTSTPAKSLPIAYDASYDDHGAIPADQSRVFDTAAAGRVDANFYSDGQSKVVDYGRSAFYPFDFFIFLSAAPLAVPTAQTQYATGPSNVRWLDFYDQFDENTFAEVAVFDEPRTYPAGTTQRVDWLRGPLAGGVPEPTDQSSFFFCPGCRTDNKLSIFLAPVVDTTPGHNGYAFAGFDDEGDEGDEPPPVTTFTIYRDGKKIKSVTDGTGATVNAPASDAVYRAVLETDLGAVGYLRSTHAVTELTFHSAAGSGGALPDNWFCPFRGDVTDCEVLPLLTANVPLPTDLRGNMPQGTSSFVFTVDGARGGPPLTASAATMSIDVGGEGERSVPVTALGGGRFRATIKHPAADAGKLVTLRVVGSDNQGDSIAETVTDAYAVANS